MIRKWRTIMESSESKEPSTVQAHTANVLSKLITSLEVSPEEILSMPLSEVLHEIANNGIDPNSFKKHIEERVTIIRGRVDSVALYEITDNELSMLETGSSNS